jgi:hypothetical protein
MATSAHTAVPWQGRTSGAWARAARRAGRLGALVALVAGGCVAGGGTDLERENSRLRESLATRDHELSASQAALAECQQRLTQARAIKPEQLKHIYYPERLEIASLSGGENYDDKPGDDGVTVYLRPVDRDGDIVKVAGDIRIELYDLAVQTGQNRIAECFVPYDRARELWYGKFMTNHYTIRCPWPGAPPQHPDITVRATFVDYLTQRVITAQTVVRVNLSPAATEPARAGRTQPTPGP